LDFGLGVGSTAEYYDPFEFGIAGYDAELANLAPSTEAYNQVYSQKVAMETLQSQRSVGPKRKFKR